MLHQKTQAVGSGSRNATGGRMTYRRLFALWLGITLIVLCFAFSIATLTAEDVQDEKDWVKGGVAAKSNSGQCLYKAFVSVGITDDDPDTDEAQLIGFTPGNVRVSHIDGKVIWERVYAKKFARRGMPASGCMQRCPMFNE